MKGPGLRLELDVRRVWRCATCHSERHTPGSVTFVVCHFCQDHPLMTLVEPQRKDRQPAEPLDLVIELHPDDVDAPAFVPAHLRETDGSNGIEQSTGSNELTNEPTETDEALEMDMGASAEEASSQTQEAARPVPDSAAVIPDAVASLPAVVDQHHVTGAPESPDADDGVTDSPPRGHQKRTRRKKRRRRRRGSSSSSSGSSGTPSQNS